MKQTRAQPILQANTAVIPAAVAPTATTTQVSTAILKSESAVTTHVMQVLLQLPSGQTVPVQIPAAITPQAVAPIGKNTILRSVCVLEGMDRMCNSVTECDNCGK